MLIAVAVGLLGGIIGADTSTVDYQVRVTQCTSTTKRVRVVTG